LADGQEFSGCLHGKKTERARCGLDKRNHFLFARPIIKAFSDGRLSIGTMINMGGRKLTLEGVYPDVELPEAMVFWDEEKKCFVRFSTWGLGFSDNFQIIQQQKNK
jgi:hypothetical protein